MNLSNPIPSKIGNPAFEYKTMRHMPEWMNKPLLDRETVIVWLETFTIDDSIEPDFYIERESTHDGTLIFVTDLFREVIHSIGSEILKYTESKGHKGSVVLKKISVTNIDCQTTFLGRISEEKHWPGQRDVMKIGVKLNYDPVLRPPVL